VSPAQPTAKVRRIGDIRGRFDGVNHAEIGHERIETADVESGLEEAIGPFCRQATQLADIPGVNTAAAAELIAETGVDMTRFPSAAHLVLWAKFCPQTHQSAGKSKTKVHSKGNPWLAGTPRRIAFVTSRTDTFLGARYRRLGRRRG
jgi:transposase